MANAPAAPQPYANVPDPERPLRIGYLSPDFRNHATAFSSSRSWLVTTPQRIHVICYAEVTAPDGRTAELRCLARDWRHYAGIVRRRIGRGSSADGVDLIVDLAGHLAGNRLRALALKPAPVQVSYLGYPGTTGLAAIDYRLTDSVADLAGAEAGYSEELLRLPGCFCVYQPPLAVAGSPLPPSRKSGVVTFGSLHKLEKLNPAVVEALVPTAAQGRAQFSPAAGPKSFAWRNGHVLAPRVRPRRHRTRTRDRGSARIRSDGALASLRPHRRGPGPVPVGRSYHGLRGAVDGSAHGHAPGRTLRRPDGGQRPADGGAS